MIIIQWFSALIVIITSIAILYDFEWQVNLILLAIQYFASFFLLMVFWPINMAGSVLISGWIAAFVYYYTLNNISGGRRVSINLLSLGAIFRLLAGSLTFLVIITSYSHLTFWFPSASPPLLIGSLTLITIGFLILGMSLRTERVILGLLTFLTGFEVAFTQVDNSILMVTLSCLIFLSIGLTGAFFAVNEADPA